MDNHINSIITSVIEQNNVAAMIDKNGEVENKNEFDLVTTNNTANKVKNEDIESTSTDTKKAKRSIRGKKEETIKSVNTSICITKINDMIENEIRVHSTIKVCTK
jgi:hypothetical protein